MAYVANQMTLVYTGGAGGQKWWAYSTTDALATSAAAGYFNDPSKLFQVGDLLLISVVDDVINPTSISEKGIYVMATVTNGSVTLSDFIGGPTDQADWDQSSALAAGFIKNKPLIFAERNATNAALIAAQANGSWGKMAGQEYKADSSETGAASVTNDLSVNGLVPWDVVTLEHFGLTGDGSDEGAELQTAFTWINQAGNYNEVHLSGNYGTSQALTLGSADANNIKLVTGELHITCTAELGASSTILTVTGNDQIDWQCHMYLSGGGLEDEYDTWFADNGVEFIDCRHIKLNYSHVYQVRNWGIILENETGSGRIQSFCDLGKVETVDCGHNFGSLDAQTTTINGAPTNNGSQNSNSQNTTLTLTTVPSFLEVGDIMVIDDAGGSSAYYPYLVEAISGSDVTVFPWVHSGVASGHTVGFLKGGGVKIRGNNSNLANLDQLRGVRCAIGLMLDQSYNAFVKNPYFQACPIPMMVGSDTGVAVHGASLFGFGSEDGSRSIFGPIMLTRAADSFMVQGYPFSKDWIGLHRPRGSDDSFYNNANNPKGFEWQLDTDGAKTKQWNEPRNFLSATSSNNVITNGPKSRAYLVNDDPDLDLVFTEVDNEEWGYGDIEIFWANADKSTADNLVITLDSADVTAGWTIGYERNADTPTSLTIPNIGQPVIVRIAPDIANKEWIVGVFVSGLHKIAVEATATDADTTPSVFDIETLIFDNTGATTITALDDGLPGQRVRLVSENSNTTIQHTALTNSGAIRNESGANIAMTINGAIDVERDHGQNFWRVVGIGF